MSIMTEVGVRPETTLAAAQPADRDSPFGVRDRLKLGWSTPPTVNLPPVLRTAAGSTLRNASDEWWRGTGCAAWRREAAEPQVRLVRAGLLAAAVNPAHLERCFTWLLATHFIATLLPAAA